LIKKTTKKDGYIMATSSGFTRQETARLCGIAPHKLSYLDETGLIVPEKIGNPSKPTCLYSWRQILEIKAISKLRDKTSLQAIRKIIDFLEDYSNNPSLIDNDILLVGEDVFWINPDLMENLAVQILGKISNQGQITHLELLRIPSPNTLKGEIIEMAKLNDKINFASFKQRAMIA
jgi:DNA-binding transcriptional MerR regulator